MILLLLSCLVDTDSGAPDAPASPVESHQIVACAPYGHVFLKGHKALEMVMVDYGDREGVVPVTPLMGGLWDFACPDVPAALHVFWID
jgi:hypothetical protein